MISVGKVSQIRMYFYSISGPKSTTTLDAIIFELNQKGILHFTGAAGETGDVGTGAGAGAGCLGGTGAGSAGGSSSGSGSGSGSGWRVGCVLRQVNVF